MKSDTLKIAELSCRTQLSSQLLGVACDPLWSTILGFVAVHELRKQDLVGPVADDILYAGIIAVNTARTPGLTDLAGKGMSLISEVGTAAVGAGAALAGAKLLPKAGWSITAGAKLLPKAGKSITAVAEGSTSTAIGPALVLSPKQERLPSGKIKITWPWQKAFWSK